MVGVELEVGEEIEIEFTPPYSGVTGIATDASSCRKSKEQTMSVRACGKPYKASPSRSLPDL
jgi:hypothetical protein